MVIIVVVVADVGVADLRFQIWAAKRKKLALPLRRYEAWQGASAIVRCVSIYMYSNNRQQYCSCRHHIQCNLRNAVALLPLQKGRGLVGLPVGRAAPQLGAHRRRLVGLLVGRAAAQSGVPHRR